MSAATERSLSPVFIRAIEKRYRQHGLVFRWKGPVTRMMLLGAEANQLMLLAPLKDEQSISQIALKSVLDPDSIEAYLDLCENLIDERIAAWNRNFKSIQKATSDITLGVLSLSVLGCSKSDLTPELESHIRDFLDESLWDRVFTFRRRKKAHAYLHRFLSQAAARERHSTHEATHMLNRLARASDSRITDEEIATHLMQIARARIPAIQLTLKSLFYELAAHPEWQERIYHEVMSKELWKRPVQLWPGRLQKTLWVIQETLRRNSPFELLPTKATQSIRIDGLVIPRGERIAFCPTFSHFMREYWSAPQTFDPRRFSPYRAEHKQNAFAYVPFAHKDQHSLGETFTLHMLSVILSKIVFRYRWQIPRLDKKRFRRIPIVLPRGRPTARLEPRVKRAIESA